MGTSTFKPGETISSVKHVAVIGLGYIGLPTAAILAGNGVRVTGVDLNPAIVEAVNQGRVPFVEPDLGIHVSGAVSQGLLSAHTTPPAADAYIVAVPTPFHEDKTADLSYIRAAAEAIAPQLVGGELIILESTSPPGTTEIMANVVLSQRPDLSLDGSQGRPVLMFAHCPERVLPGRIMIEMVSNDRIVGGLTREAAVAAAALYGTFCQGNMHLTDAATAEMAKLVENAYRDVNIAFANELSMISSSLGINVWDLIELANHHPRVNILQPGPGVGGHCIAVDPWFIVAADPANSNLIRSARQVNDSKPSHVVAEILDVVRDIELPTIAALGLTFKANIDDMRESPAVDIVREMALANPNARILVADPHAGALPVELAPLSNVMFWEASDAVRAADAVVLLVDHDAFREIDPATLENRKVVDTRGFWRDQT
ncbi:UDP-N-acetyl-D-mannosamine dehydrogenase [Pseudarthrobacter sp. H3Y2-7]|jgi:UDP-N-acetyl-D-mannosaminuronic acid dehydrogenase|uniref:UDP-N-acetyl-D-mannosamine dehydrogenase n=1 Tax=Pseudarthrobacter naphthalenicus TaxID=3031328 RepID=UPI0023B07E17|nr:UDP-N-acetyl-D-mannosamine dehydrogenase [Pseudarthrobacter sp. H3Y2-7]MDE8670736.1 UDP-N-acetyl-D-mannosamine dehydrogenase [Pseudarthrobacter sp. H3Y2-7]